MNIKLNVSKNTFESYLINLGLPYTIIQYEDFIYKLGNRILKDTLNVLSDEIKILKIFYKYPSLEIFSDIFNIQYISEEYLINILQEKSFLLYMNEKNIKFSDSFLDDIYLYSKIKDLEDVFKNRFPSFYINSSQKMKRIKSFFILNKDYRIPSSNKEIDLKLSNIIFDKFVFYPNFSNSFRSIKNSLEQNPSIKSFDTGSLFSLYKKIFLDNFDINKPFDFDSFKIESINIITETKDIRNKINPFLINVSYHLDIDDGKEVFLNLLNFISTSSYNAQEYFYNLCKYMDDDFIYKNSKIFVGTKELPDIFKYLEEDPNYSYLCQFKDEIKRLFSPTSFDVSFQIQDKEIIISSEELIKMNIIKYVH